MDEFDKRVAEIHRRELREALWRAVPLIVLSVAILYLAIKGAG